MLMLEVLLDSELKFVIFNIKKKFIAEAKLKIEANFTLLVNLLLKFAYLNDINFDKIKLKTKFLKDFFLQNIIIIANRFLIKKTNYIIICRIFKTVNQFIYKTTLG